MNMIPLAILILTLITIPINAQTTSGPTELDESLLSPLRPHHHKSFPKDCPVRLIRVGQCLDKMLMVLDEGIASVPTKEAFNDRFCIPFNSYAKCVLEYRPCLRPFQRSVLSLVVYNSKLTYKKLCKTELNVNETWSHLECFTPDGQPVIDNIKNKMLGIIDYSVNSTSVENLLVRGCCGVNALIESVVTQLDNYCLPRTGKASGQFVASLVTNIFHDILSMMCHNLPDVKTCQAKMPEEAQQIQQLLEHPNPSDSDLVLYLLKIIKKIDEITDGI